MALTYEPISTTTLSSAANSITFSSIPATYTDLHLVVTTLGATGDYISIRFNGDTSTNYSWIIGGMDNTGTFQQKATGQAQGRIGNSMNSATIPTVTRTDIFSYAGSTYKTVNSTSGSDINGSGEVRVFTNMWRSTAAINSILLRGDAGANFAIGTKATLYGIKAA